MGFAIPIFGAFLSVRAVPPVPTWDQGPAVLGAVQRTKAGPAPERVWVEGQASKGQPRPCRDSRLKWPRNSRLGRAGAGRRGSGWLVLARWLGGAVLVGSELSQPHQLLCPPDGWGASGEPRAGLAPPPPSGLAAGQAPGLLPLTRPAGAGRGRALRPGRGRRQAGGARLRAAQGRRRTAAPSPGSVAAAPPGAKRGARLAPGADPPAPC